MRRTLVFSILLNSLFAGIIGYMVLKLGGLKYVFYRMDQTEAGLYAHRKSLFEKLPVQKNAIVFLGDSQVEQCEWEELICPLTASPVINRGITGDQVKGVADRIGEINRHQPSRVFLCVGINDLLFDHSHTDMERHYYDIIRKLRGSNGQTQVFLMSIPPVNNELRHIGVENSEIIEINTRLQQIARNFAIPYIDLYNHLTDSSGNLSRIYSKDGIHLDADGYLVWRKLIEPHLK